MSAINSLIVLLCILFTNVQGSVLHKSLVARQAEYPPLPTLTQCSQSCIAQGIPSSGCTPTDMACLCTSVPYSEAVTVCLTANCTTVEALEARRFSAITCEEPVRNNGEMTRNTSWAMFSLATFGIIARFISRLPALKGSGFGWDDWTILFSWALLIPCDAILDIMVTLGLGKDIWMLPDPDYQISKIMFWFYISEYTYVIELATTKTSIVLLYLRMWPERADSHWFRRCCWLLIGAMGLFTALCMAILALGCRPFEYTWTRWNPQNEGHCIDQSALIFATAGFTIFFDLCTIALPIPRLLALNIPSRKKVAVCVTFAIGAFVTICSIVRLGSLAAWARVTNITWYYNPIAVWSNVELNLGVFCACVPAVAGLMQRIYTKVTGHKFSSYGQRSAMAKEKEKEQFRDRNYELRVRSAEYTDRPINFADGSVTFHGHEENPMKGRPTTVTVEAMGPESRSSFEIEPPAPMPRSSTNPDAATEQMINAGYSAFASLKK